MKYYVMNDLGECIYEGTSRQAAQATLDDWLSTHPEDKETNFTVEEDEE